METTLEGLSIAKPCGADWGAMQGDDRMRHCGLCKLNVYNISGMSREEAEALIRSKEGSVCVRMFQRNDGTVITKDCPVGLKKVRQRMAILAGGLAASIFLAAGSVLARMGFRENVGSTPARAVNQWINPPVPVPQPPSTRMTMGKVCEPSPAINTPLPLAPATSTTETEVQN